MVSIYFWMCWLVGLWNQVFSATRQKWVKRRKFKKAFLHFLPNFCLFEYFSKFSSTFGALHLEKITKKRQIFAKIEERPCSNHLSRWLPKPESRLTCTTYTIAFRTSSWRCTFPLFTFIFSITSTILCIYKIISCGTVIQAFGIPDFVITWSLQRSHLNEA